jgi:hypothetical protein
MRKSLPTLAKSRKLSGLFGRGGRGDFQIKVNSRQFDKPYTDEKNSEAF